MVAPLHEGGVARLLRVVLNRGKGWSGIWHGECDKRATQ
jgi:hypothetical protein